jgi:hypothetical protein
MILPVVLYGCQTWALKFREGFDCIREQGARAGEFGPEKEEAKERRISWMMRTS